MLRACSCVYSLRILPTICKSSTYYIAQRCLLGRPCGSGAGGGVSEASDYLDVPAVQHHAQPQSLHLLNKTAFFGLYSFRVAFIVDEDLWLTVRCFHNE